MSNVIQFPGERGPHTPQPPASLFNRMREAIAREWEDSGVVIAHALAIGALAAYGLFHVEPTPHQANTPQGQANPVYQQIP